MQKAKLPSLVTILVLTLVTAIMWIGFNIYRAFTQAPAPSVSQDISAPLNPTLDADAINKINSALFFSSSQIPAVSTPAPSASPTLAPTPSPIPTETPSASPSATPEVTPTATPTP